MRARAEFWREIPHAVRTWMRNPNSPPPPEVQEWTTQQQKRKAATPGYVAPAYRIKFNLRWEAVLLNDIEQCRDLIRVIQKTGVSRHLIPLIEGVIERTEKQLEKVHEERADMYGPPISVPKVTEPAKK